MLALSLFYRGSFLVPLQDFLGREFFEIQHIWELDPVVQLDVPERVEVKNDSCEMHDECIGQLVDGSLLLQLHPLAAGFAGIVGDDFTIAELAQAVVDRPLILDSYCEITEIFNGLSQIAAVFASQHRAGLTSKNIFQEVLLAGVFEEHLQPIETEVEELLSIFLLSDICWLAIKLLEAEAERRRVVILAI